MVTTTDTHFIYWVDIFFVCFFAFTFHIICTFTFSISDIVLLVVWGVLAVSGAAFQYYRERYKPPFPPCPWSDRKMREALRIDFQNCPPPDERVPAERRPPDRDLDADERTPLLTHSQHTGIPTSGSEGR